MKDDPNDDQPTTSNSVKETINDDESNSENNKSSPPRRQSSGSQPQSISRQNLTPNIKTENFDSWTPTAPSSNPTPDILSAGGVPAELLTNLFAKVSWKQGERTVWFLIILMRFD